MIERQEIKKWGAEKQAAKCCLWDKGEQENMMDGSSQRRKGEEEWIGHSDAFKVTSEFFQFEADLILQRSPTRTSQENAVIPMENMKDYLGVW